MFSSKSTVGTQVRCALRNANHFFCTESNNNGPQKYESLLGNIEKIYPDLAERLERLSKPSQLSARGKNWQGTKKRLSGMVVMKSKSPKRNSVIKL